MNNFIAEQLSEKVAQKLMSDAGNSFDAFVSTFFIRYGKLQILGYHKIAQEKVNRSLLQNTPGTIIQGKPVLEPLEGDSNIVHQFSFTGKP